MSRWEAWGERHGAEIEEGKTISAMRPLPMRRKSPDAIFHDVLTMPIITSQKTIANPDGG